MPSAEERAFLQRILANPDADGPRLIFADWLDEQNDPRGEFIRLQCALASLPGDDPRYEQLLTREQILRDENEGQWTQSIRSLVTGWEFRRGMIEAISLDSRQFLDHAPELFQRAPIRRVRLLEGGSSFAEVMQSPLMSRIRELDLCGAYLGNGGPNLLARSPHLRHLEMLDLGFNDLTDRGLESLAQLPALENLRRLHLNDNSRIATPGVRALSDSPYLRELRHLDLSGNDINDSGLRVLLNGQSLKKLEHLEIHHNRIGDGGLAALARSDLLTQLARASGTLDLRANQIGPVGAEALSRSDALEHLRVLDLGDNNIADAGLRSLAESRKLDKLRTLSLRFNRITDTGVFELWDLVLLNVLEEIDLTGNLVTTSSVNALLEAATGMNWQTPLKIRIGKNALRRR